MTRCLAADRDRARAAAECIRAHERVVAVDVLEPDVGIHARWTLEITLDSRARGLPPQVAAWLAEQQFWVRSVQPQGAGWKVCAS